jgi:hypothetical protein
MAHARKGEVGHLAQLAHVIHVEDAPRLRGYVSFIDGGRQHGFQLPQSDKKID